MRLHGDGPCLGTVAGRFVEEEKPPRRPIADRELSFLDEIAAAVERDVIPVADIAAHTLGFERGVDGGHGGGGPVSEADEGAARGAIHFHLAIVMNAQVDAGGGEVAVRFYALEAGRAFSGGREGAREIDLAVEVRVQERVEVRVVAEMDDDSLGDVDFVGEEEVAARSVPEGALGGALVEHGAMAPVEEIGGAAEVKLELALTERVVNAEVIAGCELEDL